MKRTRVRMSVDFPPGVPLLTRLRIRWYAARLAFRLSAASPEQFDAWADELERRPGIRVWRGSL